MSTFSVTAGRSRPALNSAITAFRSAAFSSDCVLQMMFAGSSAALSCASSLSIMLLYVLDAVLIVGYELISGESTYPFEYRLPL